MDIVTVAVTACITSLIGAIVGAIVTTATGAAKKAKQGHDDTNDAMLKGMRAMLWRELKNIHSDAKDVGGMDTEMRKHLEDVYEAYHAIGGNGTGTRLYEDAMSLPVLD